MREIERPADGVVPAAVEPMLRLVAEYSADVVAVVAADGQYRHVSSASLETFGWPPSEIVGHQQEAFVHPDDAPLLEAARAGTLSSAGITTTAFRFRCSDGSHRWTEQTARRAEADGVPVLVVSLRDIADRRRADVILVRQALTDPLTGVANRTVFMDRLHQALRRLQRSERYVAVLFLDLDRFKVINDSLGHRAGDQVLLDIARRLLALLRPADTLARLGGDEFAILLEGIHTPREAVDLAARITDAARQPILFDDEQYVCTVSVGIAMTNDATSGAEGLLQEADLALYRAKDRGRDRAELFDEHLRTRAVSRLATERMIRRALDEDRFVVEYQPIVELGSLRLTGAEALVRLHDSGGAHLLPEQFLGVADETGLLARIDDGVLAKAIAEVARWRVVADGAGPIQVAVNITTRHLANAAFAESLTEDLEVAGVPPAALLIEVTERVLIEASKSAMTGLHALRRAGVKIGIDDFGVGYSSLAYLRQFPLDFVKIDKSFVANLDHVPRDRAVVEAIIDLCHALDLSVTAEGVETPVQRTILTGMGCDHAQGFLFGRSGTGAAIEARLPSAVS